MRAGGFVYVTLYLNQMVLSKIGAATIVQALIHVLWAVSLAVLCTCVFTGRELNTFFKYDRLANSMHIAFVRPVWGVAVGWIVFACAIGYGGPVNWFLSLPVFQVLSKFTYTLYLVHQQLIILMLAKMRYTEDFTNERMWEVTLGHSERAHCATSPAALQTEYHSSHPSLWMFLRTSVAGVLLISMYILWGDFAYSLAVAVVFTLAFESPMIIIEQVVFGKGKKKEVKPPAPEDKSVAKSIQID